jgi:hypothetical protein
MMPVNNLLAPMPLSWTATPPRTTALAFGVKDAQGERHCC